MAAPTVAGTPTAGNSGFTQGTSLSLTMPTGITAGEMLIVFFGTSNAGGTTAATGWTKLGQTSISSFASLSVFYKTAAGSDTCTVTSGSSYRSYQVYRIAGSDLTPTGTFGTGTGTNADPPNHAPAGGSADYLWLAGCCPGSAASAVTGAPASFTDLLASFGGVGGGSASARRTLTAASLNPGTFTSPNSSWVAVTVAIAPAGGASQQIDPSSIASTASIGSPTVTSTVTVSPSSIAATTAVGQPAVTTGSVTVSPNSIAATTAVGSPTVSATVTVSPDSIASTAVVGEPNVVGTGTIVPDSIAPTATFGEPAVQPGLVTVTPDSISSSVAVGEPGVTPVTTVSPGSISSTLVVGEPAVSVGQVVVSPDSIAATTVVGEPAVSPGSVTVSPASIGSTTTVGQPSFSATITVSPDSITSTAVVGEPGVTTSVTVVAESIEPTTLVGEPTVQSIQTIAPRSIQSTTVFGDPGVFHRMWELVIPLVTEQHPWRRSLTAPLPEGETVYGTDAGLVSKRQPRNADLEGATRVYWAGHVHRTQDVVERDLWVDSGFEVNEVLV